MKRDLKIPRSPGLKNKLPPLPGSYTPRSRNENNLDTLIDKCNSMQHLQEKSSDLLKSKPKAFFFDESFNQDSVFSRSQKFKQEKEKVKQNIRSYVEKQYLDKLKKITSVVKYEEPHFGELLSPEDVQNKDAAKFFSLNKRNFGCVEGVKEVKYEKPFKPKRTFQRVNPVETVLTNIKSIMKPEVKKVFEFDRSNFCTPDELINFVKQKSPKNRIIENELLKLWPKVDEEKAKERKFLKMKLQKLVAYNKEINSIIRLSPGTDKKRAREGYLSN